MNLDSIKTFLEQNTLLFLVIFILSLFANTFEIIGFFRERKKRREEIKQKKFEEERLKVYEYLFDTAEKSIKSNNELDILKKEILERENLLPQLEKRIEMLRLAAKREIVEQNISRTINDLRNSYDEFNKLQELKNDLGELPDLPESEKKVITDTIFKEAHKPYELPKSITYKALLLVLIILLLPSPVDQILIVVLLGMYLTTFFEVATYSNEIRITKWVTKHYKIIGFLSCLGAWFFLIRSVDSLFGRPLDLSIDAVLETMRNDLYSNHDHSKLLEYFIRQSYRLSEIITFLLGLLIATIHWRKIRINVTDILKRKN